MAVPKGLLLDKKATSGVVATWTSTPTHPWTYPAVPYQQLPVYSLAPAYTQPGTWAAGLFLADCNVRYVVNIFGHG